METLEKIAIDFDDTRDKPRLPTIVTTPSQFEMLKSMNEKLSDLEKKQFESKMSKILDKKYEEYTEREKNRKLVD